MALTTRKPTGRPAWPVVLIAGVQKGGKTYAAATASKSEHIDRTFWFAWGEDVPDEYADDLGYRLEIVPHDGTIPGLIAQIEAAKAEPAADGKQNLIVLDSATRVWGFLSDYAQWEADERARRKASRGGTAKPDGENEIGRDLWNRAKARHGRVIRALATHEGPVIITARMDEVTVTVNGQPARDGSKEWKIGTEKSLPYEVGAIVQIPQRGRYQLAGVRSLRLTIPMDEVVDVPDFTVEELWRQLGLLDGDPTQGREQQRLDPAEANATLNARRADLLRDLAAVYETPQRWDAIDAWWQQQHGEHLDESEDLVGLERLLARAVEQRAAAEAQRAAADAAATERMAATDQATAEPEGNS